ncbi:MAG: CDP-alcohol phosphatidyltransferase family protein, partial [Raoultibacter sp.]
LLLLGGGYLLSKYRIRVPVIFIGKVTTTLLFVGFAGLLLNWPLLPGLGIFDVAWLPGFNSDPVSWGIWFVYAGLILGIVTTAYYITMSLQELKKVKKSGDMHSRD